MSLRATGLVYTTLLSLAPLLALCFSVLKGFGVHNQMEPLLNNLFAPIGAQSKEITARVLEFVSNMHVGVLGTVGLVMLLYSVISMMNDIEEAFNDIWRIKKMRPFALRIRDYLSVLFIGPVLLFVSVALTASMKHSVFLEKWFGVEMVTGALQGLSTFVAYMLFVIAFAALYMFMPYTRVRFVPAFMAGLVTGALWKGLGWLFGVFIAGSASYAAIYSAFAALILLIIWVYVGWFVVLLGASICFYLQNPSNQPLSRRVRNLSLRVKEKMALQICAAVGAAFYRGEKPLTLLELARHMSLPVIAIEDVVEDLIKMGVLTMGGTKLAQVMPARPFDETSAAELLSLIRAADEEESFTFDDVKAMPGVLHALDLHNKSFALSLSGLSLKALSLEKEQA